MKHIPNAGLLIGKEMDTVTDGYWYQRAMTAEKTLRWVQNDLMRAQEQRSMMLDDLAAIGEALGVNVHARPESPREVVAEIITAARIAAGMAHESAEKPMTKAGS